VNCLDIKSSSKYDVRFGVIAVSLGFVTIEQVVEALTEQVKDNFTKKCHKILGEIFFEKGWMTSEQIELVLSNLKGTQENSG